MDRDVYGVVWLDHAFGWLTLRQPDAETAIAYAKAMIARGYDGVSQTHAVKVPAGTYNIEYLYPER